MDSEKTLNNIKKGLGNILDTDLGITLSVLDAIKDINIHENHIHLTIELIQPINWIAPEINKECYKILQEIAPGYEYIISIKERIIESPNRDLLKGVKNKIAVASGKGGVGKSAIASNIASALSLGGASVGLLDADVYGPSQPTMFGLSGESLEAMQTEDGKTIAYPKIKYGIKIASMGFIMNRDEAAIIRGPMLAGYFSMLIEQLDWGELDFLIFDLPPGTGDIQLTLTQKIPLSGAVIVTTPQEISLADVRRSIAMFRKVDVDILGIIENMSYFTPPDMPDKKYYIFGEGGGKKIASENSICFLGEVPLNIKMREGNDGGKPVVLDDSSGEQGEILKKITSDMVRELRIHNYNSLKTQEVKINI
jgi:ATP-binding protein involved in chromosome partitioning